MTRTRVALAIACALSTTAVASAAPATPRELPTPGTLFGGGRLGPVYADPQPDLHLVTLAVSQDGTTLAVHGDWSARCGTLLRPATATLDEDAVPIGPDGSFSASGPLSSGDGTFSLSGAFLSPTSASGAGTATLTIRSGAGQAACTTGTVTWEARADSRLTGRSRPRARTAYYGTTTQGLPLVLRLSPNRYLLAGAALRWHATCRTESDGLDGITSVSPAAASVRGRFSVTSSAVGEPADGEVSLTSTTLRGSFGTGSVGGVLVSTTSVWSFASGALLDTCSTGTVSWAARP